MLNIINIVNNFFCKKEVIEVVWWGYLEDFKWCEGSCWVFRFLGCVGGVGWGNRISIGENIDYFMYSDWF